MSRTPEYRAWRHIKDRVFNEKCVSYEHYGGRGIKVCDEWLVFENFLKDVGFRPTANHSLDRIDNDGDYTPDNFRWTSKRVQAQNTRVMKNNTSGFRGVCYFKQGQRSKRWLARVGKVKVGYFLTKEQAALAYDKVALQLYGENAATNFGGSKA